MIVSFDYGCVRLFEAHTEVLCLAIFEPLATSYGRHKLSRGHILAVKPPNVHARYQDLKRRTERVEVLGICTSEPAKVTIINTGPSGPFLRRWCIWSLMGKP